MLKKNVTLTFFDLLKIRDLIIFKVPDLQLGLFQNIRSLDLVLLL